MKKAIITVIIAGLFASCNTTKKNPNSDDTIQISNSKTSKMTNKEIIGSFLGAVMK